MKKTLSFIIEYVLSFLLLVLYLINYHLHINRFLFLALGSVLFVSLFWACNIKVKSFPVTCIMMFCHTWQISWFNIFGDSTSELQLPWFYIVGMLVVMYAIYNYKTIYTAKVNSFFLAVLAFVYIIAFIPLILSPSKTEGLKEYIMIMFYVVIVTVAFLISDSAKAVAGDHIFNTYIWCVFISCLFLVLQIVLSVFLGIRLFYYSEGVFFGSATTTVGLLMGDLSSATIMLGSAVFICISRIEKKQHILFNAIVIIVTVIGMALTSRRTSTVSLIIVLAVYAITHYKSVSKRLYAIAFFAVVIAIMLYYFQNARPVDDLSMLLYDNGRLDNYVRVIQVTKTHPFGVGYDTVYANSFMTDNIAPHNTFLRWTLMGGPLFSISLAAIPLYALFSAYKKKLTTEFWIILYSLLASNFIPDLLTARFFVIPCMCVFLLQSPKDSGNIVGGLNGASLRKWGIVK